MDFQNYIGSTILFSVPIYFRSQEEHKNHFDKSRQKYFNYQENLYNRNNWEIAATDKMRWDLDFERFNFHVWKYTEIIGFIEFRKKENSLFVFVVLAKAKRYSPIMNRKSFRLSSIFPDYEIELEDISNDQIIEQIFRVIDEIGKSSRRFSRYYINTNEIKNFVHLIDYHSIQAPNETS